MLNEIGNLCIERDINDNICIIDYENKVVTTEIDNGIYTLKPTNATIFDAKYIENYINNNMEGILALYDLMYGIDTTDTLYSYSFTPDADNRYMEVHADRISDFYSIRR